jgi:hypothetical protein
MATTIVTGRYALVEYAERGMGGRMVLRPVDADGNPLGVEDTVFTVPPSGVLPIRQALLTAQPGETFALFLATP